MGYKYLTVQEPATFHRVFKLLRTSAAFSSLSVNSFAANRSNSYLNPNQAIMHNTNSKAYQYQSPNSLLNTIEFSFYTLAFRVTR